MTDAHYADPALVPLYDVLNGWSPAREFYLSLPERTPSRVLDAGCGTGLLAVAMAGRGHAVVGLDPAAAMLEVARDRPGGEDVEWLCATLQDAAAAPGSPGAGLTGGERPGFDLIVMTGHAFQCLLTDDEVGGAFASAARLLAPDGRFVLETRNPAARAWLGWTPAASRRAGTLPDGTPFEMAHEVQEADGRFVTFETTYRLGDPAREVTSRSTLRFLTLAEIETAAGAAGLRIARTWGDWSGAPLSEDAPEIIVSLTHR